MAEYKFETWVHALFKSDDDIDAQITAAKRPDLQLFLKHHKGECGNAKEAGVSDHRWEALQQSTLSAEEALAIGDAAKIAICFYRMGTAASDLTHRSSDEMVHLYELSIAGLQAQLKKKPLAFKAALSGKLKEMAQAEAVAIWDNDSDEEYLLHEVCELVRGELERKLKDANASTQAAFKLPLDLKPWLRPVAPPYARKQARPKN